MHLNMCIKVLLGYISSLDSGRKLPASIYLGNGQALLLSSRLISVHMVIKAQNPVA